VRRIIIGTAGHIDHGKTALVKALTGIDTDRLREEKERGISIDLGFAYLDLAGGLKVGVVDVPGHERFIKNMLAGVGGIDLVLFVVAADEGLMPQSREHFDIISLIGVTHAIFAITKADLVDDEMLAAVRDEVENFIAPTRFKGSPVVATSVETGQGLDDIKQAIAAMIAGIEERRIGEAVRLPIDRVFTMTGRGTVVTGTLWSGGISKEDRLEVQPGAHPVRVRSVEVHGEEVARALAGQRTALGIHGVEKIDLERGHCIVSPGDFEASSLIDVDFLLLASAPRPLESRTRVRLHLGASETIGRIFLLGQESLAPGGRAFAQLRLEAPVVAGFGDRFVLRNYSPMHTIGGGLVVDPLAEGHKASDATALAMLGRLASADAEGVVEEHLKASGAGAGTGLLRKKVSCGAAELDRRIASLAGHGKVFSVPGGIYLHAERLQDLEGRTETALKAYQAGNRLTWGMPREELRERLGSIDAGLLGWVLARLEAAGRATTRKGDVRAGRTRVELSPAEARARAVTLDLLKANLLQPPGEYDLQVEVRLPAEIFRKVMNLLIQEGEVVRLEPGVVMHRTAIEEGRSRVTALLKERGEATVSDLKTVLGTSRKYAVPLLEHLDRLGVTRRKGDKRVLVG
jgi:selenocysteine-specific elongation factor